MRGEVMPTWIWKYLINCEDITEEVKQKIIIQYNKIGRDVFYRESLKKKVLPFAAHAMIQLNQDVRYWTKVFDTYHKRNHSILGALNNAYLALSNRGVKKMFVSENFGALLSGGADIGLFSSGDVDNYADPCEKERIYQAFEDIGYTRTERYSGHHQIAAEFYPPKSNDNLPEGFYISVDFYPLARLKLPCFIKADDFIEWDQTWCYKDTAIVLPPPTALMYICLLHISLHSFSRAPDIRLYIDLINMTKTEIDYSLIKKWCIMDRTCTRAAVAADICNKLWRTEFPHMLTELSKRKNKVEKLVYDSEKEDLIYEPHGLKVLRIETACDDRSDFHGLLEILFPESDWMKKTYGNRGLTAHLKHFKKVL